jgi:hypothetical protein
MSARIRITRLIATRDLADELQPAMRRLANAMHGRAQLTVPKDTWTLHDTLESDVSVRHGLIVATLAAGGPTGAAPDGAPYALHVEGGTSRMRAQPYLRPALLQTTSADLKHRSEPRRPRGGR